MNTRPLDFKEVKPDFSNVVTRNGAKILELHRVNTKNPNVQIIAVVQLCNEDNRVYPYSMDGKVFGTTKEHPYDLLIKNEDPLAEKLKPINWNQLAVDTIFQDEAGLTKYLNYADQEKVEYFEYGSTSVTGSEYVLFTEKAKLIENTAFTFWNGDTCPVPEGVKIEFICRDGIICTDDKAPNLRWHHIYTDDDIIAYRILGASEGYSPFFLGKEY